MSRRFQNTPPFNGSNPNPVLRALVDVVTYITGQAQPVIEPLPGNATNAQIVAKVNEIIARLQGTAG